MQGDDIFLVQAYAKLLQAKVPGKVARSLVVMDVDKEVGTLNFLEYLMYKIENDMETEPERWTEATKQMKARRLGGEQGTKGLGFKLQAWLGGERNFAKPEVDQEHLLDVFKKYTSSC
eukprot:s12281_g1.t1